MNLIERQDRLDPNNDSALIVRRYLALANTQCGRLDDAVRDLEALRERWIAHFGANNLYSLDFLSMLGRAYLNVNRPDDAVAVLNDVVDAIHNEGWMGNFLQL